MRISLVFCVSLLCLIMSCNDDNGTLVGLDKSIVSFSLTIDGVEYPAEITGNNISVTLPDSVDAKNAQVSYELSENAVVTPDPHTVKNWEESQIFRIQSYNNTYVSCVYTMNRSNVLLNDNVVLQTQAQVDDFVKTKTSVINGNLIIGYPIEPTTAYDTIKDVSGLSNIKEVNYNIVINQSYLSSDVKWLANLTKAGGLYIGTTAKNIKFKSSLYVSLPKLENLGTMIINSDDVSTVSTPKLTAINSLYINSKRLESLDVKKLSICNNDFTIKAIVGTSYIDTMSNRVMTTLDLPSLESVGGSFLIDNFWKLSSLNIPLLTEVSGDMSLTYIRTIKTINLPKLMTVKGNFTIQSNDGMVTFSAPRLLSAKSFKLSSVNEYSMNLRNIDINAFESTTGDFTINYAGAKKININALNKVGGNLTLNTMPFVESITMPALLHCNKLTITRNSLLSSFDLSNCESLTSIALTNCGSLSVIDVSNCSGLESITISSCAALSIFKAPKVIRKDITLNAGGFESEVTKFVGLDSIMGKLTITRFNNTEIEIPGVKYIFNYTQTTCPLLETLTFANLEEAGTLSIQSMEKIETINASKLKQVKDLTIKGLYLVKNFNFPLLTTVSGTFTFYGGTYQSYASKSTTTNLDGFAGLTTVNKVDVRYAGLLNDFTGLKNLIPQLSAANWTVQGCLYNPTYQDMVDNKYSN